MNLSSERSTDEKKTMFLAAMRMAMADGHLDPSEFSWCMLIAKRIGLTESEVESVINDPEAVNFTIPSSRSERALNLIELICISQSDGEVAAEEMKVLVAFAIIYGFSADELKSILVRVNNRDEISGIVSSVA